MSHLFFVFFSDSIFTNLHCISIKTNTNIANLY